MCTQVLGRAGVRRGKLSSRGSRASLGQGQAICAGEVEPEELNTEGQLGNKARRKWLAREARFQKGKV